MIRYILFALFVAGSSLMVVDVLQCGDHDLCNGQLPKSLERIYCDD